MRRKVEPLKRVIEMWGAGTLKIQQAIGKIFRLLEINEEEHKEFRSRISTLEILVERLSERRK